MYETILVDDTDLVSVVSCIQVLDGLYASQTFRGDDLTVPGLDGELWTDKPFGSGTIDVGLILSGSTTTEFNDQYRVLKKLICPGKRLTLKRRLSYTSGNEEHVTTATYAGGLTPSISLMRFGKTTVSFKILDGLWYGETDYTFSVPSSGFTYDETHGEARTHTITITMDPNSTLVNTTTDHSITLDVDGTFLDPVTSTYPTGIDGTTAVLVDVMQMTATQAGTDVSAALIWNQRYPFRLVPGNNVITNNVATSASITYTPAYL